MNEEELDGRLKAVLITLHEVFAELGREAPLRRRVKDALIKHENDLATLAPGGDLLFGMKEARKAMGL